ncbi:UNVERIFIED_ORG: AcrR family transcriptional regulator [Arthrobacter sp. UYCu721]
MNKTGTARENLRADAARNVGLLLAAAGKLLRTDPEHAAMADIAAEAKLSLATAYRYFPTLEKLHSEYIHSVVWNLRGYSISSPLYGKAMFLDVVRKWIGILEIYGKAMTQIRSRRGFLDRLDSKDEVITLMEGVFDRPIREALGELGISEKHFRYALFLFNIIFDAREVGDLRNHGFTETDVASMLGQAYFGAVQGFVHARETEASTPSSVSQ